MNYGGIIYEDLTHGNGLRCTLLVQGAKESTQNISKEFINPKDGIPFTESTQEDIIEYIKSNDKIKGISLAGGDPLYDTNVDTIYKFIQFFKDVFKDTKDIWLYTEYDWGDFPYWENIMNSGFVLGDKYKTRINIVKLVDVIHCKHVYSLEGYADIDVKESFANRKEIIKK